VLDYPPTAGVLSSMGGIDPSNCEILRFDAYELDVRSYELRRDGIRVKVQEQPLQILQMLLERPGQLVTRDELRQKIWPSDTFVDFDHGINNAIKRLRAALVDSAEAPRYIETVASRGYRFIARTNASRRIESLAVLPLENLSRDPEQEYFAEGLTEALITTLAKIGELRVVSRTSAMQYKGVRKPIREIARELDVTAIVEGTALRSGDRVRITAQLIDAPRETHLWAESYERDLRDVLALQTEVAQAIAQEIRVKLTPLDQARFAKVHPVAPEAYDAYLKGRYHWNRRPAGLAEAMRYLELAIEKDRGYALAYAGLADGLSSLSAWGLVSAGDGCVKAKALAQKALEIDNSLAEGHTALAYATMYHYDFWAAEREFEQAIEINPRYAAAHHIFGLYLAMMGRYEEAYTEFQRAIRLDPLAVSQSLLGFNYLYSRRYDQAVRQFIRTLELASDDGPALCGLGWAYSCLSLHEPAIATLRKGLEFWPGSTPRAWLGEALAVAGYRDDAQGVLEQLFALSKERYVTPYGIARIYNALGMKGDALHWLDTAYHQQAEWMLLLKVDPCFDDLRSDSCFQDLMRRMNFPPSAVDCGPEIRSSGFNVSGKPSF
jgi:TolB-like protein/Flp pilus assembly protein TadD